VRGRRRRTSPRRAALAARRSAVRKDSIAANGVEDGAANGEKWK
jgi:hypothetical protein